MALSDFNEKLNFVEKQKVSDGMGGFENKYTIGAEFEAVFQKLNTQEQLLAQQMGLKEVWNLMTQTSIDLNPNDIILYKGNYFRVVTDELTQPAKSTIQTHQYQCERWSI